MDLAEACEQEIRNVSEGLGRLIPSTIPITILLYQPGQDPEGPEGTLIEVAPRPLGAPKETVVQNPTSGRTGSFLNIHGYASRFIPDTHRITREDIASYVEANDGAMRRRQVSLESKRYTTLHWPRKDRPPEGAYIHHLSISPNLTDLHSIRIPTFGIVYAITREKHPVGSTNFQVLINASQIAARLILCERALLLFGLWGSEHDPRSGNFNPRRKAYSLLFGNTQIKDAALDELYKLAFRFVLAHHWFYPHSPVAYRAITQLSDEKTDRVPDTYAMHAWPVPSEFRSVESVEGLGEQINVLVRDFLQVGSHLFSPAQYIESNHFETLFKIFSSVVISLSRNMRRLSSERDGEFTVADETTADCPFVSLVPDRCGEKKIPTQLPVFAYEKITRVLRRDPSKWEKDLKVCLEQISPGNTPKIYAADRNLVPEHTIELIHRSRLRGNDVGHRLRWFHNYVRYLIELDMER